MRLDSYDNKDGYRVVLTERERSKIWQYLDRTDSIEAWDFASKCGLRRGEISHVQYRDLYQRDTGDWILRVWEDGAKRSKYRETPVPENLAVELRTVVEQVPDVEPTDSVISVSMKTVERDLIDVCEVLAEEEGDDGYLHVRLHDGRRTWAQSLLEEDVAPLQVMDWGGWDDWRTFKKHYLQDFSEQKQSERIEKVSWI